MAGVLCGIAGVVLVALAGDPREKRGVDWNHVNSHPGVKEFERRRRLLERDPTSLDRMSRRFDETAYSRWTRGRSGG